MGGCRGASMQVRACEQRDSFLPPLHSDGSGGGGQPAVCAKLCDDGGHNPPCCSSCDAHMHHPPALPSCYQPYHKVGIRYAVQLQQQIAMSTQTHISFSLSLFSSICGVHTQQQTGFETEKAFYRAMLKGGRNNMAILAVLGLMAIPTTAAGVAIVQR